MQIIHHRPRRRALPVAPELLLLVLVVVLAGTTLALAAIASAPWLVALLGVAVVPLVLAHRATRRPGYVGRHRAESRTRR